MNRSRLPGHRFFRFLTEPFWFVVERTGRCRDWWSFNPSCLFGWSLVHAKAGAWSVTIGLPFLQSGARVHTHRNP